MGAFAAEATGEGITPERLIGCGMGEIVSFRRARKKAERRLAEKTASANRLRYGRSKAARKLEAERDVKARRDLDGHRIETGDER
jgi:transposase